MEGDFDPIAYLSEERWRHSKLGLERIRALLESLGNPQERLRFVHVAGTNGKGSVCAYLASILQTAGYRTGLFTSPYIERFEERIRIDGRAIGADDLSAITCKVRDAAEAQAAREGEHPTEFEMTVALALLYFAQSACDIVVLEVGLGGRLDSTNVIAVPELAVITRIGLDHTAELGNTLAEIAAEKAGIIKPGAPVLTCPQEPEVLEVLEKVAQKEVCPLHQLDFSEIEVGELLWSAEEDSVELGEEEADTQHTRSVQDTQDTQAQVWRLFSYQDLRDLRTSLLGTYQPQNAALALKAALILHDCGWRIPDEALHVGVAKTKWPGRFEIVAGGSSPQDFAFVVDGAHNPQAAAALVDSLSDAFPDRKPIFVIGVMEDKDYPRMLEAVLPSGAGFIACEPSNPRALSAAKLARAIRWTGQDLLGCSACTKPYVARSIQDAVDEAFRLAGENGLICAFGSLYMLADIKAAVRERLQALS